MSPKYLKGFCALSAGWIYLSSCFVITRFQFAEAVTNITHIHNDGWTHFLQGSWWIVDRAYHIIEFAILTYLMASAFSYFKKRPLLLAPIMVLYAASDEYHQSVVNFPAAHTYDVAINCIGVVIALWIFIRSEIKHDSLAPSR